MDTALFEPEIKPAKIVKKKRPYKVNVPKYIFFSFIFCLVSGAAKLGAIAFVVFLLMITMFFSLLDAVYHILYRVFRLLYRKWLHKIPDFISSFKRR